MEKKQAQQAISGILQKPFNHETFRNFIQNLLNNIEPRDNHYQGGSLWESFREHITQYWRIGKYTDPNGDALDILVIETKNLSKLDRARTSLRNFVVKHLQTFNKDHALAAFYSKEDKGADWRFSFIKIEHEAYKDEKGKVKTRPDLTPAKRYSFLVGEHENSYTAQKQLLPLLEVDYANPTLDDIENAFSIEKVTDEFFQQYKELYLKLLEYFQKDKVAIEKRTAIEERGLEVSRFIKKLLGQIVFLYFLQKKGWLGVPKNIPWGKGEKKFLRKLFEQAEKNMQNFYSNYLQFLFYEALAKDRHDSADPAYYQRFDCKIPFLNGGLFEADYDWENSPISIPNELFHNDEKDKAGDVGTGILDVFDRYNFTVKEDEPLEKEVAIDPEMLGKVFENMLEVTERKSKGAYYTPREIVHYMCQESLIHYLDNAVNNSKVPYPECEKKQMSLFGNDGKKVQLRITQKNQDSQDNQHIGIKVPKGELEDLVRKGSLFFENDSRVVGVGGHQTKTYSFKTPSNVRKYASLLDEKLSEIRICDPAIGSGAFPVGLLHEIVTARSLLSLHLEEYPVHTEAETLEAYNKRAHDWLAKNKRKPYDLKRHAIQECIYGIDIDPSAIDIARLRLWLSLIVDEDDFYNIEALPNLDYKIMQGNSLISEFMGINFDETEQKHGQLSLNKNEQDKLIEEFRHKKDIFRDESDKDKKVKLRQEIDDFITQIFETKLQSQKADFFLKLKEIEEKYSKLPNENKRNQVIAKEKQDLYKTSGFNLETVKKQLREFTIGRKVKPFFLWKLYFAEIFYGKKIGFDVVIGNPPYLRIQGIRKDNPQLANSLTKNYKSATGSYDLYIVFTEKGLSLINKKGVLNYIMPTKWTTAAFGKGARKLITTEKSAKKIISFGAYQVFNASTYTGIQWFQKDSPSLSYLELDRDLPNNHELEIYLNSLKEKDFNLIPANELAGDAWILTDADTAKIFNKISSHKQTVKDIFEEIFTGLQTSKDSVYFILKSKEESEYIVGYSKELDKQVKISVDL